jgi:hypothetical protein
MRRFQNSARAATPPERFCPLAADPTHSRNRARPNSLTRRAAKRPAGTALRGTRKLTMGDYCRLMTKCPKV